MSVRVQSKVWERSKATGNAFVVLLKIADNADDNGCNAWPSLPSLARYCRCSVSTVQRSIKELEALGELEVVHKGGGKTPGSRYAPNLYRVYPQGCQIDHPQVDRDWSNSPSRPVKSGDRDWSPVTTEPSCDPSRTAAESNRELSAAHLALAREALGVEKTRPESEATHPESAGQ